MSKTAEMTLDEIIARYRMHGGDAMFLREVFQEVMTLRVFGTAAVSATSTNDACRAALANIMARIDSDEFIPTEYKEDARKALASLSETGDTARLDWLLSRMAAGEIQATTGLDVYGVELDKRPALVRAAIDSCMRPNRQEKAK